MIGHYYLYLIDQEDKILKENNAPKEVLDVLEILDILNKKYNVDVSEAKGKVDRILKKLSKI